MDERTQLMFQMEMLLRNVYRKLKNEVNKLYGDEITRNEFLILKILGEQGQKKTTDLSKYLEVSASHITAVTDSLLKKKWITRTRSREDRRMIMIDITPLGKEMLKKYEQKKSAYIQKRLQHLSNEELEKIIVLMKKMLKD